MDGRMGGGPLALQLALLMLSADAEVALA